MNVFRIEISPQPDSDSPRGRAHITAALRDANVVDVHASRPARLFFLEGALQRADAERIARELVVDPVTETSHVLGLGDAVPDVGPDCAALEIHPRPGVMDPVAETMRAELCAEGYAVESVRTARRYVLSGNVREPRTPETIGRLLANDCVEEIVAGTAGVRRAPTPRRTEFRLRHIRLRGLDDGALDSLSRTAHLFLSRAELQAIRSHYEALGRDPTDVELETLAQTWSEHCVHKTLRSRMVYRGAPLPGDDATQTVIIRRYDNLLRDTIARATAELMAAQRGPQCLSVFKDNAGVITFDDDFGIAFKVETHNHPSAIEPYGGAATGIGGVIRDVIGCGLGAKPIANTDVFCVAPSDWPYDRLPKGVLHPGRILRGVVSGVADYGNRMGIPTVNGAVYFDPRYLGNPLVYCGCVGLIPRNRIEKAAAPGDLVVVIGGRTGRDGIHGATFSSAELTDTHVDEFSHAVQIGNAITEKRFLDALLQARDHADGCLYSALTDCGAGGLSSAIGEMAEHVGATVELDTVPLKYAGLRYDEIWISEAQERMVVAVPPDQLTRFLQIMNAEEVEATIIGNFGCELHAAPALLLRYAGQVVAEIDLAFLHGGVPQIERTAEWQPPAQQPAFPSTPAAAPDVLVRLRKELARPNVASKEWIIRRYDHEVQGASVLKPLPGPGRGPGDAAVLRPRLASARGIALASGLAPHLADVDPYWMAAAAIDEAIRNVVCVGGDPGRTALLDNFCWGRTDDPHQLGALVRACQACYDAALAYGVPFISGKDSLNNEFALDPADVEPLIQTLRQRATASDPDAAWFRAILPDLESRLRARHRLAVPATLLISALSLVDDVRRCVTPDLKRAGDELVLIGGLPPVGFSLTAAADTHRAVAALIRDNHVVACHDLADGGWLVAAAEMAIAGTRGAMLRATAAPGFGPFDERVATYLVETADAAALRATLSEHGLEAEVVGTLTNDASIAWGTDRVSVTELRAAWALTERRAEGGHDGS